MNKKLMIIGFISLLMLIMVACGGGDKPKQSTTVSGSKNAGIEDSGDTATKTIEYLGKKYTLPKKTEKIVITGAMEAMEDAVVLDVHPAGAISVGGKFPKIFASITSDSESIGEKQQPNFEKILKLKPDVILGSSKFQQVVLNKLEKIAPTIPISHIATNWEANLELMADLTGKQKKANKILTQYKTDVKDAKASLKEKLKDKKVAIIRIRGAQAFVYPEDVYFNPVLYKELDLTVPQPVSLAKTQEAISVEQLGEMNPDYLFVQFSTDENQEAQQAFDDMKKNPVIQNMTAFKKDQVYINVVHPLLEGGPAYSRIQFLEALQQQLENK
ncbi:ABC transporter substrate-binding protein [Bacillus pumilus]|uniref:ABC transporter substrate-binding protein n=1 Tax=Bacillus pumilus TaxID=1408 RepID=UPI00017A5CF1|nr:ABC transporter substrate-binding protein [Bacillus pumilus]EDW22498.1 iron-uptake system-binding protein [Bacillus pumilus ATCC 7061]MCR4352447.1 ABC transporter substrate-binding protein [Bacillus pumilus]MCY7504257.1 ABC transporter substrate-binding protein [Bacillus pumilus]MDR4268756.1 ABC transporter substrate-binding protein [Bacillus pumilus]MED4629549.1 ABC transporter substrate-binding protein [Bacillus pumilus]